MNTVILRGRTTELPTLRATEKGAICTVSLAVPDYTHKTGDGYATTFVKIVGFNGTANLMEKYLVNVGQEIIVPNGKLVTGYYESEKDNCKKQYCEVHIDGFEFVGKKKDADEKKASKK